MEITIRTLCELRNKAERDFIDASVFIRQSTGYGPMPNAQSHLDTIIELNQAIEILQQSIIPPTKFKPY
jgi:hypothetical protein